MRSSRRGFLGVVAGGFATWACSGPDPYAGVTRYVRYEHGGTVKFGILNGDTISEIEGDLFGARTPSGATVEASAVKLLYPVEPSKVFALADNYRNHLDEDQAVPRPPRALLQTHLVAAKPRRPDHRSRRFERPAFRGGIRDRDRQEGPAHFR